MRLPGIDRLRGIAIGAMVIDHGLVAFPWEYGQWVRLSITRIALPIFCILAGSLYRHKINWKRLGFIVGAGVAVTPIGYPIGIGQPDILLLIAAGMIALHYLWNYRIFLMGTAIIQPFTWHIPWTGYQPGTVLALIIFGSFLDPVALNWNQYRNNSRILVWIGQHPLGIYCGHILILFVLKFGIW